MILHKFLFVFAIYFVITTTTTNAQESNFLEENYSANVIAEGRLDAPELIRKHGFPVDTHTVTTADDYILTLHHIKPKLIGPPVLLVHGLLDSSSTWVVSGPKNALAYYLHNEGYDVWLGNVRGNRYSRNHTRYNPNKKRDYWSFSWHEIGTNDLPAMIDYVLGRTSHRKLYFIGHSQGTTAYFVMSSLLPSYNNKVALMSALAPVAFWENAASPLLKLPLDAFHDLLRNFGEVLPHSNNYLESCFNSQKTLDECVNFLISVGGNDPNLANSTNLPTILGHYPAGANLKQWLHYKQLSESGRFRQYDYGLFENYRMYRSFNPPDYPLDKITTPISLHYVRNDNLAAVADVQRLSRALPNVIVDKLYPSDTWNHYSLVWDREVRPVVYKDILTLMKTFSTI